MGARSRAVLDDARSETSMANVKDRVASLTATSKSKKLAAHSLTHATTSSKITSAGATAAVTSEKQNAAADSETEAPHIEWSTMPTAHLQNYRSAYRLQIPSSYTQSHADLLYNSCDLALRAPSQVFARRKTHDLKTYRRKQSQLNSSHSRAAVNGISKSTARSSRMKDKERDSNADSSSRDSRRRNTTNNSNNGKDKDTMDTSSTNLPAEAQAAAAIPPSPTSHPSNQDSLSNLTADNASRTSRLTPLEQQQQQQPQKTQNEKEDVNDNAIPNTLNQTDPDVTILGSQSPGSLATSIRKHFNAQQLNEAETIARFTYVVRQQGSNTAGRAVPLAHRPPRTTASLLPTSGFGGGMAGTVLGAAGSSSNTTAAASGAMGSGGAASSSARQHAHMSVLTVTPANSLGGNHVQFEGSWGDGAGWIMSTTSCGRQVRMPGEGGGGTFRLRFRP